MENKTLKILALPMENDGCTHYRITKPYKSIARQFGAKIDFVKQKDIETPEMVQALEECDYLLCRGYHDKAVLNILDPLFKGRKELKVIVDMDDDVFNIDPYNEAYQVYGTREVKHGDQWLWKDGLNIDIKVNQKHLDSLEKFLKRADILTVSTERLKKNFERYNKNVIVVPNAIDPKDWVVPNFKDKGEIRIGWTGGISHYKDWYPIKDDVARIMKEYPRIKLCIAGALFEGLYKDIDPDRIEFWHWVDPTGHGYRTAMMNLDLAIIPLEDIPFNTNKSCIKFYEFSSLKIPTICSNVPPYSDEAPKESLTNNFYETIKYYIENPDKAEEMAEKNYNWVKENRNQDKIAEDLYKKL